MTGARHSADDRSLIAGRRWTASVAGDLAGLSQRIIAVMRHAGDGPHGLRARALVVLRWRAGLRVSEALAPAESDLDRSRGAVLVRHGKGGKRREVGMDPWGRDHLRPWLEHRLELPVGALICIINGPTRGPPWSGGAAARAGAVARGR